MVSSAARRLPLTPMAPLLSLVLALALQLAAAALPLPGPGLRPIFPGDKAALASLKSAIDPATIPSSACLASWDFALDPCAAFTCGVHCVTPPNSTHKRVAGVTLDSAGYSGTLPAPVLASLPFLDTLIIRGNRFHGALPAGVALPRTLLVLDLSGNAFSGAIPGSLFTPAASSLDLLDLSGNAFSGAIPPQIASLGAVRRIGLHHNGLTGSVPSLGKMRSLAHLDLSANKLSGPLLDAPGRLPRTIFSVVARDNRLSGPLQAAAFRALPYMQVLDLTNNAVTGAVPGAAFEHPSLGQLRLGSNQLSKVEEPSDGGKSSELMQVDLSGNRITGRLPRSLGALPYLVTVGLDGNRFVGGIPSQYAARVSAAEDVDGKVPFRSLLLQGNYLCGALPRELRQIKEGRATLNLADNCLPRCPHKLFFCQGPPQKNQTACPKKCEP